VLAADIILAGASVLAVSGVTRGAAAQTRTTTCVGLPRPLCSRATRSARSRRSRCSRRRSPAPSGSTPASTASPTPNFDSALAAAREFEVRWMLGRRPRAQRQPDLDEGRRRHRRTAGEGGLSAHKGQPGDREHPAVDKLLAAGAVLRAQTTAPEFYFIPLSWSRLWGVTRNPWNLRITVGGYSGSSGAALAAGLATLATGSDMGGSITSRRASTACMASSRRTPACPSIPAARSCRRACPAPTHMQCD
jgi:hypothetical protein